MPYIFTNKGKAKFGFGGHIYSEGKYLVFDESVALVFNKKPIPPKNVSLRELTPVECELIKGFEDTGRSFYRYADTPLNIAIADKDIANTEDDGLYPEYASFAEQDELDLEIENSEVMYWRELQIEDILRAQSEEGLAQEELPEPAQGLKSNELNQFYTDNPEVKVKDDTAREVVLEVNRVNKEVKEVVEEELGGEPEVDNSSQPFVADIEPVIPSALTIASFSKKSPQQKKKPTKVLKETNNVEKSNDSTK